MPSLGVRKVVVRDTQPFWSQASYVLAFAHQCVHAHMSHFLVFCARAHYPVRDGKA